MITKLQNMTLYKADLDLEGHYKITLEERISRDFVTLMTSSDKLQQCKPDAVPVRLTYNIYLD